MPTGIYKRTEEHNKNIRIGLRKRYLRLGYVNSMEARKKISETMKGRKYTIERRKNISMSHKGKKNPLISGDKHYLWKEDNLAYSSIHDWIRGKLGKPQFCEGCGTEEVRRYHWANISGEYSRDFEDWIRLCVPCHKNYDSKRYV